MKPITKAILPVAGFGTRFLPATKAQPKEMLPIFDTPAIQHIVQEAVEAGIKDIIIVTGRGKRAIEDHFDANFELEHALFEKKKMKELEMVQELSDMANFVYVRQPQPLGDGHALLCAQSLVEDDESVVVLFGDDIVDNPKGDNAVKQLMKIHEETGESVVSLEKVAKDLVSQYGIVEIFGCALQGERFDTGDKLGFLKATLHFALKQETEAAKEALKQFIAKQ